MEFVSRVVKKIKLKKFTVQEESTLKIFTDNNYAQASFVFRTLLKEREIKVNGVKVGSDVLLKKGDEVQYFLNPAQEKKQAFAVVYEDENVLVVDKESGVNSEAVFAALQLYPIHRLDRNTAGLLILAKTKEAEEELLSAFKERRVEKIYHALVVGKMPKKHAVEEAYLEKGENGVKIGTRGEKIVTEYEVLEEFADSSLLKITLHTGKTHQIRAHMAYLGHPVVGDEKYGDSAYNKKVHATRQKLLAKSLTLQTEGVLGYLSGKTFTSEKFLKNA